MKKFVSLMLVVLLLVNISAPVTAESPLVREMVPNSSTMEFDDMVPSDYWSYQALSNAIDVGLMQGASRKIRPNDKMTRAEIVTIITNALGLGGLNHQALEPYKTDISNFKDVNPMDWFYNQISVAYNLQLVDGMSRTEMAPRREVTREQAFKILSSFMSLDHTKVDTTILHQFKDEKTISSWAKPYVASLVREGYVAGYDGYLKPGDVITRQEFAQLLYNLFGNHYISDQTSAEALSNQALDGNLIVSAQDITLENINVTGDIIIGDGVGNGDVTLDQVKITGRLIVRGGGEHSIYLKNTTATRIIVNKRSDGGVRVYSDDGSEVSFIEIQDGKDTVIIDCDVENVLISKDELDVVIHKNIKNLTLTGDNVHISGYGTIDTIVMEKGVKEVLLDIKDAHVINLSENTVNIVDTEGKRTSVLPDTSVNTTDNLTTSVTRYFVSFHSNGGSTLTGKSIRRGDALGELPVPQKENAIFIGWFTDDDAFENAVAKDTRLSSDLDLYAKYISSDPMDQSNVKTTTSVMDVEANHVVTIVSTDTGMTALEVENAIIFETITEDPSEFAGITVSGSAGTYEVRALEGYSSGSSYSIELKDEALSFQGEIDSVRKYNINTVIAEPVLNLQLSSSVKFVPETEISSVTQNGEAVDSIFAPLYTIDDNASEDELYGTFTYLGTETLAVGNQVAIYSGTNPNERLIGVDYTEQPISYVNISGINGNNISYGNSNPSEIIFTPDVLPVNETDDQDGDPNNDAITIAIEKMTYISEDYAEMGLSSSTTVDRGDYIAFYSGDFESTDTVTYAEISDVSVVGNFYVILYEDVSEDEVLGSMDMASSSDLSYQEIASNVGIENMEVAIEKQVEESGFAEAASEYLIALAQTDDPTRMQVIDVLGIQNFSVIQSVGPVASLGDSGPSINVKVNIDDKLEHYSGKGVRCEVTITTEIELGDDMSLTIKGTFVEEFKMKMNIKSKTVWKWKGIIPYIADYKVRSTVDVYNYTYLALNMNLKSESSEGWSDTLNITDSIETLQDMTSEIDANDEVREFYQLYQAMMEEEHAYFKLFDQNIAKYSGSIDPYFILAYSVTVDFVVSLDANAALGSEFSYEKATRYTFAVNVKSKTTSSKQTDLRDEKYDFSVYVMGELGIRAGIKLSLDVGLISTKLNSVGISAEVGAYYKIWGFLYYNLASTNGVITTKSSGASYMEIGIYFTTAFKAQIGDGKIEYKKVLYSDTWPLWHAGSEYHIYDFSYTPKTIYNNDRRIILKGNESSYTISESVLRMFRMNFKTGKISRQIQSENDFTYTIKDDPNKVFNVSDEGVITVKPPKNSDIASATLEIVWNKSPLSFTSVPISRTFKLEWDNLADHYVIDLDTNGGDNESSLTGAYQSAITMPTPKRAGYVFDGWYTDNNTFNHAFTAKKMPATNTKLYAKWIADEANYTVYHYQEDLEGGGYTLVNTDIFVGTTESEVTPAVRTYLGFQAPITQTVIVEGYGDTVVEYYYLRNEYDVTFILNNGSANMVSSLKYGSEIVAPKLYKAGYTFDGWNTTVVGTMPAEDLTYSALWTIETYTISYDLDGGSENSNPATYTIDSDSITLNNPTKTNYIFAGWIGTGLSGESKTVTVASETTGNRYYTATWKEASDTLYSVYHYREDVSGDYTILEVESLKGIAGNMTEAVAKSYPNFVPGVIEQEIILADETSAVEIRYDRDSYVLTFDANGGEGGTIDTIEYDADIVVPNVTKTGHVLNGWDQEVLDKMPAEDTTYIAQWLPITYNIIFNKNADDATGLMEDMTFTYDEAQDLTANTFERTGYTFVGWTMASDGSGTLYTDAETVSNLTTVNEADVILYAKWSNTNGFNAFDIKYSAQYQVFDMSPSGIGGRAFDSSWGSAGASFGHQFSEAMLSGRYFVIRETGSATANKSIALYMYESDGAPVIQGISNDLYANSLIGLSTNINLDAATRTSLESLYGPSWAEGLASVGYVNSLWDEGFKFDSSNGFGHFFSGKAGSTIPVGITRTNLISNPTIQQLKDITDYEEGPLMP